MAFIARSARRVVTAGGQAKDVHLGPGVGPKSPLDAGPFSRGGEFAGTRGRLQARNSRPKALAQQTGRFLKARGALLTAGGVLRGSDNQDACARQSVGLYVRALLRAADALARREEQAGDASQIDDRLRAAALDRARQKSVPRSRPSGSTPGPCYGELLDDS